MLNTNYKHKREDLKSFKTNIKKMQKIEDP